MSCGCDGDHCALEPDDPRHGTMNGYTHRDCRCADCREAQREYWSDGPGREHRERYRAKLRARGLTTGTGLRRQRPYKPRPASRGPRPDRRIDR